MPAEMTQDQDTTTSPQEDQQQTQLPEGTVLHTLSDDDDDDEDGGQEADALDKRGRRSWAREAKQKLADYETRFETMQRELAELRNRPTPQAPQPQPQQTQQPANDMEAELQRVERIQAGLVSAIRYAPKGTPESQLEEWVNEHRQLENYKTDVRIQARLPQQQRQPAQSVELQMLVAQFPDIYRDDALRLEAQAEALRLSRSEGKPVDFIIAQKANQRVMQRHGIGQKRPDPTAAEKAKLSGTPGRAGASGTNGNQVQLSKRDVADALAYFNGATGKYAAWSEKQKVDYWVKNVKLKGAQS